MKGDPPVHTIMDLRKNKFQMFLFNKILTFLFFKKDWYSIEINMLNFEFLNIIKRHFNDTFFLSISLHYFYIYLRIVVC